MTGTITLGTIEPVQAAGTGEELPFRPFERQPHEPAPASPFVRFVDPLQAAWYQMQRSLGGILALIGFAAIAGLVGTLAVRDLRGPSAAPVADPTLTPVEADGGPSTLPPTSEAPVFVEPPATHRSAADRAAPSSATPAGPSASTIEPTTVPLPTTPLPTATTKPPSTASTAAPTTAAPTTRSTQPTTAPPPSSTPIPTTAAPATADDDDDDGPLGPPLPLIQNAVVTRVRATTARVQFTSASCVTASFVFGPEGERATTISGGSRCANSFTLLLGTVTPRLTPATNYAVTITATDGSGASSTRRLSFTTLG